MDWLDGPDDDEDDGSTGVAQALASPRSISSDEEGSVPTATPTIVESAPQAPEDASREQDLEATDLANPEPEAAPEPPEGTDEDAAPYVDYGKEETPTAPTQQPAQPAAAAPATSVEDEEDPYAEFTPTAPKVPAAPVLPDAEAERDQLAHQIASFNPNDYKPSQGRRIGAAIAAGMAQFGHVPNAAQIGQNVLDAPLNRARAVEQQKEAALQQEIQNKQAQRAQAQQDYSNEVQNYNMQDRNISNQARVAEWKALAQQRRAVAQQKLSQVDPRTLGPVDPNNPFGEWQGKNAKGEVIRGLAPPASVQKDPRFVMQQRRNDLQQMEQDGIKLTQREKAHYLAGDKTFGDPTEHTTVSIRENPDGSPAQPRGSGQMSQSLHDRIINEKNTALSKAQQQHAAGLMGDDEYQQALQDAQDNFEQRVEEATGQKQPHVTVNEKFQFVGPDGKVIPTSSGNPQQGATPPQAQPAQQQPAQFIVKAGNGQKLTDKSLATQYLQKAGGDKGKARQLALKDGWKL